MRRIAFAGIAILILAIATAVLIPRGAQTPDAQAILTGVAHAMEEAKSLHLVYRSTLAAEQRRRELPAVPTMSGAAELWLSERGVYARMSAPDGKLAEAFGMNADTHEWWALKSYNTSYQTQDTLYVADLTPVGLRADEIIAKGARMFLAGEWKRLLGSEDLSSPQESVATETRDSRKVVVLTVTGAILGGTGRNVFEVDAETNHLLALHRYFQAKDAKEELIALVDTVEYGQPLPAHLAAKPDAAETVPATATVEEAGDRITMFMKVDDEVINRMDVPR